MMDGCAINRMPSNTIQDKELMNDPDSLGIALISLINTPWATKEIYDGRSSVEWVKENMGEISHHRLWHFSSDQTDDLSSYHKVFPDTSHVSCEIFPLLDECVKTFKDCDHVLFVFTDAPLNDPQVLKSLIDLHISEMAEYTFTENYPEGVGAEVLSYPTLKKLRNIASGNNEAFQRGSISKIIHFDINQYDVEVLVSEKDQRKERLTLVCDNKRNYLIIQQAFKGLSEAQKAPSLESLYDLIGSHPGFMRSTPAYVEIEITNDCQCECVICPRSHLMKRSVDYMPFEKYQSVIDKLKAFCDEVVVALTLMGEPTLHPKLFDIIEYSLSIEGITLILETNGILLDKLLIDRLISLDSKKLIIIIALDSPTPDTYLSIRGGDNLKTVENHASYLLEKRPENSYLQILRLKENDELLDSYYQKWEAFKDNIILQKYNPYRNLLVDRKGADLSPLKRFSCWHLKRDLSILTDGTVAFCKQDINGEKAVGNVFTEGIEELWDKLKPFFIKDHKGEIDPFCDQCDEWFTYNF